MRDEAAQEIVNDPSAGPAVLDRYFPLANTNDKRELAIQLDRFATAMATLNWRWTRHLALPLLRAIDHGYWPAAELDDDANYLTDNVVRRPIHSRIASCNSSDESFSTC